MFCTAHGPTKCLLYSYYFAAPVEFMGSAVNVAVGPSCEQWRDRHNHLRGLSCLSLFYIHACLIQYQTGSDQLKDWHAEVLHVNAGTDVFVLFVQITLVPCLKVFDSCLIAR